MELAIVHNQAFTFAQSARRNFNGTAIRKLEYTKAQALARVKDEELRKQLLSQAIANDWSLSQIKEQIIANTSSEPSALI